MDFVAFFCFWGVGKRQSVEARFRRRSFGWLNRNRASVLWAVERGELAVFEISFTRGSIDL